MPDLTITFNGETLTIPLEALFTGQLHVNIVQGRLRGEHSRLDRDVFCCAACGSHDVRHVATVTTGVRERVPTPRGAAIG